MTVIAKKYRVEGLVQGVGFRPFVLNLAVSEGLHGRVLNDAAGVLIEAIGPAKAQERFEARLLIETPPLGRIQKLQAWELALDELQLSAEFSISASEGGAVSAGVVPDAATCPACLRDIRDPDNRRFGYFHTNCTHCGPRLSILERIPYDRHTTSMSWFIMCSACQAEYDNPEDRRFHAQPNACPKYGPKIWFEDGAGQKIADDPISFAAERLLDGAILGIKGMGGYQIAVDATNHDAVAELRRRKRRPRKPLAVMACDSHQLGSFCEVSEEELCLSTSSAAPILLLKSSGELIADDVAPGMDRLGVMLPNTPLHYLLLEKLDRPIVMTSGNITGNPQEICDGEARKNLTGIVDGFLTHNRKILNRVDDSVMRIDQAGPIVLRRARGLAPAAVRLHSSFENAVRVFSLGGDQKSSIGLLQGRDLVLSQHIGDLDNKRTLSDFKEIISFYLNLYDFKPDLIVVDDHPQYRSRQFGEAFAREKQVELVSVQHHHAHMASVLAAHGWSLLNDEQLLGIVLDGAGWGNDGTIWGGEFLRGGYSCFERAAHFPAIPLPGGDKASREPWRNLIAHLWAAFGPDYRLMIKHTELEGMLATNKAGILDQMLARSVNTPLSSSIGRLFDAVAAALGICFDQQSFEGEAAMKLEAIARSDLNSVSGYSFQETSGALSSSYAGFWGELLADLRQGADPAFVAARFHRGLVNGLVNCALKLGARDMAAVVLSGGAFQNSILRDGVTAQLMEAGCSVLGPAEVPLNDGGLAVGQAAVAAATHRANDHSQLTFGQEGYG